MEAGILFYEEQRFKSIFLWIILISINSLTAWAFFQQIIMDTPIGNNPAPDSAIIAFETLSLVLLAFFLFMHLKTIITNDYIEVNFVPLMSQKIQWNSIEKAYVRTYRPLREFGGWGVRYSFNKGKAYNVSGNQGLQLELKNGKKILIGTQKSEELERLIGQLNI